MPEGTTTATAPFVPAVTFTYAADAAAVPLWCRIHHRVGLRPVVIEDGAAPLPPWASGWLAARRVPLIRSSFPRRGNLNGTDTAAAIAATIASVCRCLRAPAAIKIDIDTAVIRPATLLCHHPCASLVGLAWPAAGSPHTFGLAYLLAAPAARAIAAHLSSIPLDPSAPEDRTIWQAAATLGIPRLALPFDPTSGPFAAVPHFADPSDAARRFSVLTWGNPDPSSSGRRSLPAILSGLRSTLSAITQDQVGP